MLTTNPFDTLSTVVSANVMHTFVIVMIALVILGTVYDVVHKQSARYFAELSRKSAEDGARPVSSGEKTSIAITTLTVDVLTSAEFCNPHRRIAHLLGMYGFVIYVIATCIMVFGGGGGFWALLWYIGALMICVGGYWFWFFIRVDVASEGAPWYRLMRADLFVLSLLGMATFGLLWAVFQYAGWGVVAFISFLGYLGSTILLFGGVPWSKFAHMFFKPAAAYQKRVAYASGQAMNLPTISRDDPEQQKRHSMELLRDAPMDMGLGIKREDPRHY